MEPPRAHNGTGRKFASGVVAPAPVALAGSLGAAMFSSSAPLPPVPVPAENPITEEKRVLGKILFWDEQLSSDNTVACGTCHLPDRAGADPRLQNNPGLDGLPFTDDDKWASPGVIRADATGAYVFDPVVGLKTQVTGRSANPTINAAFAPELFWDGRAPSTFLDPETGLVSITSGGALENQAVGPPLSDVEMAHAGRDWPLINTKLETARPLALAMDLPPDLVTALASNPSYPDLFGAAFGDAAITAERIAYAIATYERTLISDQSPWDDFMAGDAGAMTAEEQTGWATFQTAKCVECHTPPLFTDHTFRNIGLRPVAEDNGRQAVTETFDDRGKFKTPGLRNLVLRRGFMHTGKVATVGNAVAVYIGVPLFPDNVDPLLVSGQLETSNSMPVVTFLESALLDPRVAAGEFPFDRPTLRSELGANPAVLAGGVAGGNGIVPRMIAATPPNLGNSAFKLGVADVDEGESVTLRVSLVAPVGGEITPDETVGPLIASSGAGVEPVATAFWPIPDDGALDGVLVYFQWATASGGRSPVAEATLFCGNGVCSVACPADLNGDGIVDNGDIGVFIGLFLGQDPAVDLNGDGIVDFGDIGEFLGLFAQGC